MPYIAIRTLRIRGPRISVWQTVQVSAGSSHTGGYLTLTFSGFFGVGEWRELVLLPFYNQQHGSQTHRVHASVLQSAHTALCLWTRAPSCPGSHVSLFGRKRAGQSQLRLRIICHASRLPVEGRLQISQASPELRCPDPRFPVSHCYPCKVCRSVSPFSLPSSSYLADVGWITSLMQHCLYTWSCSLVRSLSRPPHPHISHSFPSVLSMHIFSP